MSYKTAEKRVLRAFQQLNIITGEPLRKNILNKVYLDRNRDAKLTLLSFVTNESESSIIGELINQCIRNFENKNGELEELANELLNDSPEMFSNTRKYCTECNYPCPACWIKKYSLIELPTV